jgi:DNA-binding transcriptional ArsR family regulator
VLFAKLGEFNCKSPDQSRKAEWMNETEVPDKFAIAHALAHPVRVGILTAMNTPRRQLSPARYRDETGELLGTVAYHFKVLTKAGLIEMVDTRRVRGSTEHIYEPVMRAMAWTKAYEALAPAVKQNLAATALRWAVESIGGAVDAGTFDARPDSHLSFDVMRVDTQGWHRLTELLNTTLLGLIELEGEVEERLEKNPQTETWLASYLMSGWEAAPRPDPREESPSSSKGPAS